MKVEKLFQRRLREILLVKYPSLDRFYLETGFSKGHVSQMLRGVRSPSLVTVARLARVLEVDPRTFFESPARSDRGDRTTAGESSLVAEEVRPGSRTHRRAGEATPYPAPARRAAANSKKRSRRGAAALEVSDLEVLTQVTRGLASDQLATYLRTTKEEAAQRRRQLLVRLERELKSLRREYSKVGED